MKKIFLFFILLSIASISIANAVSLSCPNCYVDDCECTSDCDLGVLIIYRGDTCSLTTKYELSFSGGTVVWKPKEEKTYKAKIYCDDGQTSSCTSIDVTAAPSVTTTTFIPPPTWPPRPKPTPRRTTTPTTTTSSTTSTTTTTTTVETTTTTTTTITLTTTTIKKIECGNYDCEIPEENYGNCPQDCESGENDGYCDKENDGVCDPDCSSKEDPDCEESNCGDDICEKEKGESYENCPEDCSKVAICNDGICDYLEGGENYLSCPEDCTSGSRDGYCDSEKDGICDPDCSPEEDPDCKKGFFSSMMNFLPYILLILAIIFILLLFFIFRGRGKAKKEEQELRMLEWIKIKLRQGEDPEILRRGLREEGFDPNLVDKAEEKLW